MSYVVSARKYRPARFDEVVGQQHVSQTLKKAFQTDHLAHAFLFCGPRGVGKTTCARILAKVLNCQNLGADLEPCGTCDNCQAFNSNASFNIMELDAASNNSVDHIRALVEQVRFQPQQGKYKIFIIDEVHMLSQAAFNAFLKTLEEPPPYAIFILATTEKHKIIPTILSRCQIFDFKRIQAKDIVAHLSKICADEGIEAEAEALHIIAQKADGALRDALSIFDRIVSFSGKKITYEDVITNLNVLDYEYYFRFTDALLTSNLPQVLLIYNEILENGFEPDLFVNGLAAHLRNLLVCQDQSTLRLLDVSDSLKARYHAQAKISPASFLLSALNLANECDVNYKMARNKKLHVEMAIIKMTFITQAVEMATNGHVAGAEKKTPDLNVPARPSSPVLAAPKKEAEKTAENIPAPPPRKEPPTLEKELPKPEAAPLPAEDNLPEGQMGGEESGASNTENTPPENILREPELRDETPAPEPTKPEGGKPNLRKLDIADGMPKLQSMESIHAEIEEEEAQTGEEFEAKLTLGDLENAWGEYIQASEKDSVKSILKGAETTIEGEEVKVTVGSALAESLIRQERGLMEYLREKMQAPRLSMRIKLDPTRSNAAPAKPRPMTPSEKYWKMKSQNPLIDEVRARFDLKLENE